MQYWSVEVVTFCFSPETIASMGMAVLSGTHSNPAGGRFEGPFGAIAAGPKVTRACR